MKYQSYLRKGEDMFRHRLNGIDRLRRVARQCRLFLCALFVFQIALLSGCGGGDSGSNNAIYGSIAVNAATKAAGIFARAGSQVEANSGALTQCGGAGCVTVLEFFGSSQCGALARGTDGSFGWAYGSPQSTVEANAKAACTSKGGVFCTVQLSMCNS